MLYEPVSAEAQRRLRRVAGKLLGEQVRYHAESRALGISGESVRNAGLGKVLSVTDEHIIFASPNGEDVVGLGDLHSLEINVAPLLQDASNGAPHPAAASVDEA
jgi:hypothetical protein